MSADMKRLSKIFAIIRLAIISNISIVASLYGMDLQGIIDLFEDPLSVNPAELKAGVILPGEKFPIACHETKNISEPLALGEAVDLALCTNPLLRSSWANIKIQSSLLGEAKTAYLPTLLASTSQLDDTTHYTDSTLHGTNMRNTTLYSNINWRLFDFGGRSANKIAALNTLQAALQEHDAAIQKAVSDIIQTYFDAMSARAAYQVKVSN